MIFLCFGVDLWVASFANLQAGILASQSAARKYILSPVFLNTFYVGAFIVMLCSCLVSSLPGSSDPLSLTVTRYSRSISFAESHGDSAGTPTRDS